MTANFDANRFVCEAIKSHVIHLANDLSNRCCEFAACPNPTSRDEVTKAMAKMAEAIEADKNGIDSIKFVNMKDIES